MIWLQIVHLLWGARQLPGNLQTLHTLLKKNLKLKLALKLNYVDWMLTCIVDWLQGSAMYAPEKEVLVWKIKNFPGGKEFMLRCKFGLPSVAAEEEAHGRMPPIRVTFEIPYFTVSGIQVRADNLCKRCIFDDNKVILAGGT